MSKLKNVKKISVLNRSKGKVKTSIGFLEPGRTQLLNEKEAQKLMKLYPNNIVDASVVFDSNSNDVILDLKAKNDKLEKENKELLEKITKQDVEINKLNNLFLEESKNSEKKGK